MNIVNHVTAIALLSIALGWALSIMGVDSTTILTELNLPAQQITGKLFAVSGSLGNMAFMGALVVVPLALSNLFFGPLRQPSK